MALPSSGTIDLAAVNVELRKPYNTTISLNDPLVRRLGGKPSGTIAMSDLYGKSYTVDVNVVVFNGSVIQSGTKFNVNYNIYSAYIRITVGAGASRVYYNIDGGSSGNVNPNSSADVQMPQGYGRQVSLSLPQDLGSMPVTVTLIGQVYP